MQNNPYNDAPLISATGSGQHIVCSGDCLISIAHKTGHHIDTLINEAANKKTIGDRTHPEILNPGDRLTIPEIRRQDFEAASSSKHTFKKHCGETPMLRLIFLFNDEPRANVPYILEIEGGSIINGETDSDGGLEHPVPPQAKKGKIRLEDEDCEYQILLGHIDPIKTISGVLQRLKNLGFDCDANEASTTPSERLREAIKMFHQNLSDKKGTPSNEINISGNLDNDLFEKLEQEHGS
jgi:hypothetical protein